MEKIRVEKVKLANGDVIFYATHPSTIAYGIGFTRQDAAAHLEWKLS